MFDRVTEINLLFDIYALLLTEKQREIIRLYHCENLSLSEISDEFSISRQAVHDALKNAENTLTGYESKLGLVKKLEEMSELVIKADKIIETLLGENTQNEELTNKLHDLKKIMEKMDGV